MDAYLSTNLPHPFHDFAEVDLDPTLDFKSVLLSVVSQSVSYFG